MDDRDRINVAAFFFPLGWFGSIPYPCFGGREWKKQQRVAKTAFIQSVA
jgi:hypothetical protein